MALWWLTKDGDEYCRDLYRRHYSSHRYADGRNEDRSNPNRWLFVGPGRKVVLRTWEGDAMWVWRKFINASGQRGINCAVFRNESRHLASRLVAEADAIADWLWPSERHYTYVNAKKIRSKNPGFCFLRMMRNNEKRFDNSGESAMSNEVKSAVERLLRLKKGEGLLSVYCPKSSDERYTSHAHDIACKLRVTDHERVAEFYLSTISRSGS